MDTKKTVKVAAKEKNKSRLFSIVKILLKHNIVAGLNPVKLRLLIEDLGSTYVKIGQILATRPDLLNQEYCRELEKLHSNVRPLDFETIRGLIEKELEKPISEVFESINEKPLGSASIAQVHSATLKDGSNVVVKVQRPNIYNQMKKDIDLLKKACKILKLNKIFKDQFDFIEILNEMWAITSEELDFLVESSNIIEMQEKNADVEYVKFPKIYTEYTTSKILVMEKINGIKINDLEKLTKEGYNLNDLAEKLCDNYVKQIFVDAYFHADPHPGNVFVEDGKIAWIDLGMVGKLDNQTKNCINKCLKAVVTDDIEMLMQEVLRLCPPKRPVDMYAFRQDVSDMISRYLEVDIENLDLGELVGSLIDCIRTHHLKIPASLTIFARGIITIEDVVAKLSPQINLMTIVQRHLSTSFLADLNPAKDVINFSKNFYSSFKKMSVIPNQLSQVLDLDILGKKKIINEMSYTKKAIDYKNLQFKKLTILIMFILSVVCSTAFSLVVSTTAGIVVPTISILVYIFAFICLLWLFIIRNKSY